MDHVSYIGSGPYCYSNALAMMLGKDAPSPAVIEFATSSPFGMQIVGGKLAFFDPYGWDPTEGFDAALEAAGWRSTLVIGKDGDDALLRLKEELGKGPVFVGPVEMGYLRYQPGSNGPMGADHYVVVIRIEGELVELHDPHGHPYATIPVREFMMAWKAESIAYGKPYMMRAGFREVEEGVTEEDIVRRSIPNARKWLSMTAETDMPPGSVGNGAAAKRLAAMIEADYTASLRGHLTYFAVRVGARRLADAATCLSRVGYEDAARIMAKQARLVGSLQYSLVVGNKGQAVDILHTLAPTYEQLGIALQK